MKKITSLILTLILIFSLVSCSSSLEGEVTTEENLSLTVETVEEKTTEDLGPIVLPEGFSAGFGREVVNPKIGTALGGWATAENRLSRSVMDDICITCTALSDGENIFLLYSLDALYVGEPMLNKVAKGVEKLYGIPEENVIMNATHTHSAPILHYAGMPGMKEYLAKFYPALDRVTDGAIRDLENAELFIGTTETENLNYVRRYVSKEDGSYLGGTALGHGLDPERARHETEADSELQVIKFDRKTKKDIVLCNWQCHPTTTGGEHYTGVSADWVGALRDAVEAESDVFFSYHQGAAGNLVPSGLIRGEKGNGDHIKHGKEIAAAVKAALENSKKVQSGPFCAEKRKFKATKNEKYLKSGGGGKTETLLLYTLSIGDVAFATNPCEMHDTNGMELKEGSPFGMTFVCAYSNGVYSYIPSSEAYSNGGYETNKCHFVKGTGEEIVKELLEMLENLKKAN